MPSRSSAAAIMGARRGTSRGRSAALSAARVNNEAHVMLRSGTMDSVRLASKQSHESARSEPTYERAGSPTSEQVPLEAERRSVPSPLTDAVKNVFFAGHHESDTSKGSYPPTPSTTDTVIQRERSKSCVIS
eukprot:TRINITY_DN12925_c0_g1_i1.p1 TRINITY_DN12925_c0_g1~~TRINITY_DN12925_c0_g1_i1.p1  ORF type:complete len:132 (+),score=16.21 TRINITY_DN12925_c0_g1_i1:98-493(+)